MSDDLLTMDEMKVRLQEGILSGDEVLTFWDAVTQTLTRHDVKPSLIDKYLCRMTTFRIEDIYYDREQHPDGRVRWRQRGPLPV